jgi:hypothetical protein
MAFAQDAPQTIAAPGAPLPKITFESQNHHGNVYPSVALGQGMAGVVHLCCTARADRSLDCQVALEWPRGRGFGSTAMRMAHELHVSENSYAALQAAPNASFQVPVRWEVVPAPPELAGVVQRMHDGARDLCGPNTGEAPEYIVIQAQRMDSPHGRARDSAHGFDRDIPGSTP